MPRKSAAALALSGTASQLTQRPAPSPDLTDMQKVFWVQIANALPADWFGEENKALLAEYVRTMTTLAFLNRQIDAIEGSEDPAKPEIYFEFLKRREALVRISLAQATKMRLTQQSRYGKYAAAAAVEKPRAQGRTWEYK